MTALRIPLACLATSLFLALATAVATSPAPEVDFIVEGRRPRLERFSADQAMRHVRRLAGGIGIRVRATPGERAGARYVAKRFRSLGYSVHVQEFRVDGRTSRNVIAWWPGARRYPLLLGAHMDTVTGSPGANDNASGVAVLLETARLVAGKQPAELLRFVTFGSEEYGANGRHHVGSEVYVRRLPDKGRRRLAGMLSVDMIADGRPLIVATAGTGPKRLANRFAAIAGEHGIGVARRTTCDCSDNGPFEKAGVAAALVWSGKEPNYHDDSDTTANLRPRDILRTGRALRFFVKELDVAMLRRLRRA